MYFNTQTFFNIVLLSNFQHVFGPILSLSLLPSGTVYIFGHERFASRCAASPANCSRLVIDVQSTCGDTYTPFQLETNRNSGAMPDDRNNVNFAISQAGV